MDRIIYTSMTGASAAAHRQAVLSNNLANVSTNGFRAEMSNFRSVPMQGDGSTTRVFALEATSGHVETPGPVQRTGRPLDGMALGNAWFAVQGLDGTEAYTRNGAFTVTAEGQLVTHNGLTVLSDGGGPIEVPQGAEAMLGSDGTITARVPGRCRRPSGASSSPRPRPKTRCSAATTRCSAPPRASPCRATPMRASPRVRWKAPT
jgi:flagellar basal-body rod protein FlgF